MGKSQSKIADCQAIHSEPKTGDHVVQAIYSNCNENSVRFVDVKQGEILKFKPSRTKLVAYTVPDNLQFIYQDADTIKKALWMNGVIPEKGHDHVYKPEFCTFENIKESFTEHAKELEASRAMNTSETENTDLLIFFFSGHGIVNDENRLVGLAPKDYDDTEKTLITSEKVLMWLQDSGYKANILFIIDACYSGGFHRGESHADFTDSPLDSNVCIGYAMYSSTYEQESHDNAILQHSIFSYCLSRAIYANAAKKSFSTGLPIQDIEETYACLTYAICLLVEIEPQSPNLKKFFYQTNTKTREGRGPVDVDPSAISDLVSAPREPIPPKSPLNSMCLAWFESCEAPDGPLYTLQKEGHLEKPEVVDIVLCFMMRYIAYSHAHDDTKQILKRDFFSCAYDKVVITLDKFTTLKFGDREFKLGTEEYIDYLQQHLNIQSASALQIAEMLSELKV